MLSPLPERSSVLFGRRLIEFLVALSILGLGCALEEKSRPSIPKHTKEEIPMLENITWLGHASFKITGEKVVYIDPWKLKEGAEHADIILITHDHYDHLVPEDVMKIQKESTTIVTTADGAKKLSGNIKTVKAGDTLTVEGIQIEAVPAYNIGKEFHPKASGWVGYIVTIGGQRIYHPGDTDLIPEMENVQADIAFLPVGGTYTMNAEEAAQAANKIKPKVAVPMHYGTIVGSIEDAKKFQEKCQVPVDILTAE